MKFLRIYEYLLRISFLPEPPSLGKQVVTGQSKGEWILH